MRLSKIRSLPYLFIGFGFVLELRQYLANRSLWVDEALLVTNILHRSPLQFFSPLDYEQQAGIGFLLVEKIFVQFFGDSEYVLRLFPFLASILALFLFYQLVKKILSPAATLLALGLFALSDPLHYYASEAKPYSIDLAVSLLLYLTALVYLRSKTFPPSLRILLLIVGAVAVWLSQPSIFILAGIGVSLAAVACRKRDWQRAIWLCTVGAVWLISFAVHFHFALGTYVQTYANLWNAAYLPILPSSLPYLRAYVGLLSLVFDVPLGLSFPMLGAAVMVVGMVSLYLGKRVYFFLFITPLFLTMVASGLHLYPFSDRFLLFLAPTMFLFLGEGIGWILHFAKGKGSTALVLAFGIVVLLSFRPIQTSIAFLLQPRMREEIKPLIGYYQNHRQTGDIVYVYYASEKPFVYYAPKYGISESEYIVGITRTNSLEQYVADLRKLRGKKRAWLLFSHVYNWSNISEEEFFIRYLDTIGRKLDHTSATGASLYLYDLSSGGNRIFE